MKKYISILMVFLLCGSCSGQSNNIDRKKSISASKQPEGTWKVDKEFDENGNLIRYDSIYSWSSDKKFDNLSIKEKDSILKSMESSFFNGFSYLQNQGFEDLFTPDSLFSKHFFSDDFFKSDFGNDFRDIEKIREKMMLKQKQLLKKYQSEIAKPKEKAN